MPYVHLQAGQSSLAPIPSSERGAAGAGNVGAVFCAAGSLPLSLVLL